MKKIALFLIVLLYAGVARADYKYYWLPWFYTGYSADWNWGNPSTSDTVLENSADTKFEIVKKDLTTGSAKYRAFISLVAHEVTEHGAKFCLQEIWGYASSDGFHRNEYQNPYVPGDFQCAWFCEPGYDGVGCTQASGGATACDMVDYEQAYSNLKSNAVPSNMGDRPGNADKVKFFNRYVASRNYEQHIILGAIEFKKHGIVAQPMLVSTNGTNSYRGVSTAPASGGIPKTLCALGYTKNDNCDLSSTSCSTNVPWCRYFRENKEWGQYVVRGYDSNIHYKEPDEEWIEPGNQSKGRQSCYNPKCKNGFGFGTDLKCSSCADDIMGGFCDNEENENNGQCMKCNVGQWFDKDSCSCKQISKIFDKKFLETGPYNDKQCWSISDIVEYKQCVTGEKTDTSGDSGGSNSGSYGS